MIHVASYSYILKLGGGCMGVAMYSVSRRIAPPLELKEARGTEISCNFLLIAYMYRDLYSRPVLMC
jgi:hypothetical protein